MKAMIDFRRPGQLLRRPWGRVSLCLGLVLLLLAACTRISPAGAPAVTAAPEEPIPPAPNTLGEDREAEASDRERHVALSGDDQQDGSRENPWRTLQHAVDQALPGDRILVHGGEYAGCRIERSGTAEKPITLQAAAGETVVISAPGPDNEHESNIEIETWEGDGRVAHWIIRGFEVKDAPGWGIDVRGSEERHNDHITITANRVHHNGLSTESTGIFAAFSDYMRIEDNESFANGEHGIYVNNSSDHFTIRGNRLYDNAAAGVHLNGDASFGGDGLMSDGYIGENVIHDNGREGGAAINMDGVEETIVVNNLLYRNHASGIALFQQDGAVCSRRNQVWFNTVLMPADGRWALIINGSDCADNQIANNILLNEHEWRGSINIASGQAPGLQSDFNIVSGRFTLDDGETVLSLADWQALGFGANSFMAAKETLFAAPGDDDYALKAGSPAIDAGLSVTAVTADIVQQPRPAGSGYDIGAYEFPADSPAAVLWLPLINRGL